MTGRQIANLQGARGIAAFLIVLHHAQPLLNRVYGTDLHSYAAVFGVDIFFVLSGFVMVISNPQPSPPAATRFLVQRFFRIVPLYWLATAAIIAFFLIGYRPVGLHQLDLRTVAESFAFVPSQFRDGRHDLILTVGWTLMFELFFYLALALTFPLRSITKSVAVLAVVFGALSLFGQFAGPLPHLAYFYTSPIMIEFIYGAVLALLYLRWPEWAPRWLAPAGLALLLVGVAAVLAFDLSSATVPNKHDLRFLILGLPAAAVIAGVLAMERGGWVLKQRFFLELGAASYALYLFHTLLLQMTVKSLELVGLGSPVVAGTLAVIVCVVAGFAIHWWIERPLLRWSRRLTDGPPQARGPSTRPALAQPID